MNSSLKRGAKRAIWSFVTAPPRRICAMKARRSWACPPPLAAPAAAAAPPRSSISRAISATVSCRKAAASSFTWSSRFIFSFSWSSVLKVEGSMLGNILTATGRRNSMRGTTRKMVKGTMRNTSAVVRVSCWRSRRVRVRPCRTFPRWRKEMRISKKSSFVPVQ